MEAPSPKCGPGRSGSSADGALVGGQGLVLPAELQQHVADGVLQLGRARSERRRLLVALERAPVIAEVEQHRALAPPRLGIPGIEGDARLGQRQRLAVVAELLHEEAVQRGGDEGIVRLGVEGGPGQAVCLGDLAAMAPVAGHAEKSSRVARIHGQGLLQPGERGRRPPLLEIDQRQRDVGVVGTVARLDRPLGVARRRPRLTGIVDPQIAVQVREQAIRPRLHWPIVEIAGGLQHRQEHGGAALGVLVAQRPLQRVDGGVG